MKTLIADRNIKKRDRACYRLYGQELSTAFSFANSLAEGRGTPSLSFELVEEVPLPSARIGDPIYASPPSAMDGNSDITLHEMGDCHLIRFRTADFYLWEDRILCHLPDREHAYLAEIQLLGIVMSLWLELRGIPALHASAVSVNEESVAFLSSAGGGKSSLAMALMMAGHPMMTDDILPVERAAKGYMAHTGYPQVRMWPRQAQRFLGHYENLETVHPSYSKRRIRIGEEDFGAFCGESRPLKALYLPLRRNPEVYGESIEFSPLPRAEAAMHLIAQSFVAPIAEVTGLAHRRLAFFSALVREVPVRRVLYPEGFEWLQAVSEAIEQDLSELRRETPR